MMLVEDGLPRYATQGGSLGDKPPHTHPESDGYAQTETIRQAVALVGHSEVNVYPSL